MDNLQHLVSQHMRKQISNNDLLSSLEVPDCELLGFVIRNLENATTLMDSIQTECLIYLCYLFELPLEPLVAPLSKLIVLTWHRQHENIAMLLQKSKSPKSVAALFEAATLKLEYLSYDDSYALAVKCIWALGDVGNSSAASKLLLLSKSDNDTISKNALKQLQRIKARSDR